MKILLSALEPSANLHVEPIIKMSDNLQLEGIFDPRFGEPLLPSSAFSIMGFLDALPKIKKAKKAIQKMAQMSLHVDRVLLIDSPAFNLPLAKAIKEINPTVEIIYYILPQVWAWKKKRIIKVEKYCDVLASILPFEKDFYTKSTYVGHPLLDEIAEFKSEYKNSGCIAYLPGSRKSEIRSLMPIYKKIASKIKKINILVIPPQFNVHEIKELYGDIEMFEISRDTHKSFLKSEFAFVCSGTATLEAALIGVPLVLVYKAKKIDYMIARFFVKLKHVGLANIIMDFEGEDALHVELLQDQVTEENILNAYYSLDREKFFHRSLELRKILSHGSQNQMIKLIGI